MSALRDKRTIDRRLDEVRDLAADLPSHVRIMEVCGTHTMALHRSGLKPRLEEAGVEMVSGPGCPVCITPDAVHEAAIDLVTRREGFILATFGDMTRVPTRKGSLREAVPAPGSVVRIVYSPEDALDAARKDPGKEVVFFGAGFETTIPGIAYTARRASEEKVRNYSVLTALWLIPPAIRAILQAGECAVTGFLYPGHVSAIIGESPYAFVAGEFGIPGAIAGFEPLEMLNGILSIMDQVKKGSPGVANEYRRVVRPEGNPVARALMDATLELKDAVWRGLGRIPGSGLKLRPRYSDFDAETKYGLDTGRAIREAPGCRCGEVLRGVIRPADCRLFGKRCTPDSPLGPCMVSTEGACLITHRYARNGA
ncbi:MAG TPA: hydrogenase formation protein HypD [Acidobacteriota bacterium]|nr:hydrogenase formation protein HypD [Acidobacteriota bacterium]